MKTKPFITFGAAAAILLSSCVTNKKYAEMQDNYQTTKESLVECTANGKSMEAMIRDLKQLIDLSLAVHSDLKQGMASLKESLDKSMSNTAQGNMNISKLVDEINSSNKYIKELVAAKSRSDSLNLVLTTNLTRSLDSSELKDVDVKVLKGVVYISLNDNMLYKSGSYEISPAAMDILGKIAKIIKDYKDYDVLVEGNTDNVPISRTNIRNNWDLSALRASSVVQALQDDFGIDPSRLSAAGRGEYNPVATNSTAEGRAQNRRTQIIITPNLDQFMDLIDKAPETSDTAQ